MESTDLKTGLSTVATANMYKFTHVIIQKNPNSVGLSNMLYLNLIRRGLL
jgi:hypothetical protein